MNQFRTQYHDAYSMVRQKECRRCRCSTVHLGVLDKWSCMVCKMTFVPKPSRGQEKEPEPKPIKKVQDKIPVVVTGDVRISILIGG